MVFFTLPKGSFLKGFPLSGPTLTVFIKMTLSCSTSYGKN